MAGWMAMLGETEINVKLNTRQAQAQMKGVVQEGKRTSGKINSALRAAVGKGFRGTVGAAAGTAASAGVSAVRAPVTSGLWDMVTDSIGGLGSWAASGLFQGSELSAQAKKMARDDSADLARAVGMNGGRVDDGVRAVMDARYRSNLQTLQGMRAIHMEEEFRANPIVSTETADAIVDAIGNGFENLMRQLGKE